MGAKRSTPTGIIPESWLSVRQLRQADEQRETMRPAVQQTLKMTLERLRRHRNLEKRIEEQNDRKHTYLCRSKT